MQRRKNIGLYVAMLENEISYAICEGAYQAAHEMDANLFILPGGIIGATYDDVEANYYRYQYNTLFSYAQYKDLDAVVLEYGAITSCMSPEKKVDFLKQFGNTPAILIAGEEEGYSSICLNNKSGIESAVHHLIKDKQCKKVGFVSGPIETSQDAQERLDAYISAMIEDGMQFEKDWIAYGNFSEFTDDAVVELLTKHPDMDGLVFANDHMTIGGYRAIRKMGLEPGKDILVTGFDDSPIATSLRPRLTSVKSDAKEIAYRAVKACEELLKGQEVHELVDSYLVVRESSSREQDDVFAVNDNLSLDALSELSVNDFKTQLYGRFVDIHYETNESLYMKEIFDAYFEYFVNLVDSSGDLHFEQGEFIKRYNEFSLIYQRGYVELNDFFGMTHYMHAYLSFLVKSESDRLVLQRAMMTSNQTLLDIITRQKVSENETNKDFEIILSCITRDMLQFSKEEKKKYESVMKKLQRMGYPSGHLYTYGMGVSHGRDEQWKAPEWMYVKAYYNGGKTHLYSGKEKRIKSGSVFSSNLLPKDRRFDMLILPLFSGEDQYGLLLVEAKLQYFMYTAQFASQVSVSIELLEIIKKQNAIKKELERNLAETVENNRVLDEISRSDHLTGVLNRRGFLSTTRRILEDEVNYGKKAIAIYADMDNLKIINDEFGHEEGDYSLKTIANSLSVSFRQSDVVARMGGDEFAAFAIVNQENFPEVIRKRIHEVLERFNEENDKPYRIAMSIGIVEFEINETTDIERILSQADMDLYIEKKAKCKQVYK
ncbi:MAG: GGDEF domain-containing protein [Lachnospiraceae bacterium]|nr:GGDEF domain-containing protein [Lachnospiraceae bacterium]